MHCRKQRRWNSPTSSMHARRCSSGQDKFSELKSLSYQSRHGGEARISDGGSVSFLVGGSEGARLGVGRWVAGFCDPAVRGPSAHRIALWLAVRSEAAPAKVVAKNIELGHPALQMLMGMLAHTAGRVPSAEGLLSQVMLAQISILVGCMQSTLWANGDP